MEQMNITLNKQEITKPLMINQYSKNFDYKLVIFNSDGSPYQFKSGDYIVMEIAIKEVAIILSNTDFTIVDNTATFKMPREVTLNSGKGTYNVSIVNDTDNSRIACFSKEIVVKSNSIDEGTVSTDLIITAIENLNNATVVANSKLTELNQAIANGDLDNKVDKVSGKALSTNDFTDTYKNEVDKVTNKQDKIDNTLNTTNKTVVGAINELSINKSNKTDFAFVGNENSGYEIRNNIIEINIYYELSGNERIINLPTTIGKALVATVTPIAGGMANIMSITSTTITAKMSGTDTKNCFIFIKALKPTT